MLFQHATFLHLDSIDSTNNYAANIQKLTPLPEGSVITARYQVQGRGQRGNLWESAYDQNLLFSVLLYPRFINASRPFLMSELVSVALQAVLEEAAGRQMSIKWPNDILCDERKISGILIEQNWTGGNVQSAIVGIGINLNQVKFEAGRAISLRQITGLTHDPLPLLRMFMSELEKWYMLAYNGNFAEIREAYHSGLFGKDAERKYVLSDGRVISATIEKVDDEGLLHLTSRETGPMKCGLKEIGFLY